MGMLQVKVGTISQERAVQIVEHWEGGLIEDWAHELDTGPDHIEPDATA